MHKNINSVHRVEHIPTAYRLSGALVASQVDMAGWAKANNVGSSLEFIQ